MEKIRAFKISALFLFLALGLIITLTVCDSSSDDDSLPSKCEELNGYCVTLSTECAAGFFGWEPLGCDPQGDSKCCLPDGSCSNIGGYCEYYLNDCASGYAGHTPMDCPGGRADQCCIPVE